MSSPNWSDDDELMADLSAAVVPTALDGAALAAARGAFAWRTMHAGMELARMFYDSYLDEAVLVRGRPAGGPRTLVFRAEERGVEIEVSEAGIDGQLVPAHPGLVALITPAGTVATTTADEVGYFTLNAPPRGPIRLGCSLAGGAFHTEWITL